MPLPSIVELSPTAQQHVTPLTTDQLSDEFHQQWETTCNDHDSMEIDNTRKNDKTTISPLSIVLPPRPSDTPVVINQQTTRFERVMRPPIRFSGTTYSSVKEFYPHYLLQVRIQMNNFSILLRLHTLNLIFLICSASTSSLFFDTELDTMTLHEVLKQSNRLQFIEAVKKELNDHISRGHWKFIPDKYIPSYKQCISMVWSTKHKRNPIREIVKWKAYLCTGGH